MSEKLAGIFSMIMVVGMIVGLIILSEKLGFTFDIDYGETITIDHGIYDEEKSGAISNVGWYILIISSMLGWRLYHWLISGKMSGNLEYRSRLTWKYVFIGLTIVTILTETMYMFNLHHLILKFSSLAILIVTGWLLFISYGDKLDKHYKVGKYYEKKLDQE